MNLSRLMQDRLDTERSRNAQLRSENGRLREAARLARDVIDALEWVETEDGHLCPWCGGQWDFANYHGGNLTINHESDCERQAVLAALNAALGADHE